MSQTLSLEPGKYSLFITPPVAGVDFTGSPTPSVSYQWKKNGAAIAGQTTATISGVWVGQTGGTVDLVDGDTISIDIILTNPVQVTTKTVSAVIDASIPAPVISPISIRLASAPTTPVSTFSNSSIGSQIMVASTDAVNVVTTPPLLPTYQWRRGFAPIAGATSQTYTLQAADADSIIDCVVSVTNAGGTASSTASVIVGTVADAGWTTLTPASDSRLIYVSSEGNDAAAAAVYSRGYYSPEDDEIGADPTNPTGEIIAYRTVEAARSMMRTNRRLDNYPSDPQYPDWLLLRRGDEFVVDGEISGSVNNGGRSNTERRVYTAWGDISTPRPVIVSSGSHIAARLWGVRGGNNSTFMSLDFRGGNVMLEFSASNILIEDCRFENVQNPKAIEVSGVGTSNNVEVRRTAISGVFSSTSNNAALFFGGPGTLLVEDCVMDWNGYKENPRDATTWTAPVGSTTTPGQLAAGTGVQPTRSFLDRNMYLNAYEQCVVRGSIFSRDGGGGSVQMREGGIAERNLFIWNESALGMSHPQNDPARHIGALAANNVVLHDDCWVPAGSGWGQGIGVGGATDDVAVLDGNIVAHFHRGNNGQASLGVSGKGTTDITGQPAAKLMKGIIKNNSVYREFAGVGLLVLDTVHGNGVLSGEVTGNAVSTPEWLSMQGDATKPAEFVYSGNKFHSTTPNGLFRWGWYNNPNVNGDWRIAPYTDGAFSQWQAVGYDTDATLTSDFAAFKASVGWTAPERDIVSYMQSVDPTYVVDEDVYVDEDASIKQATRQRVWEVLSNSSLSGDLVLTEQRAKQVARRYHAFITFVRRAKENRRGAWDQRWTAEAVTNYIRAGFGKAAITGAYDSRSLSDRLSDYTT